MRRFFFACMLIGLFGCVRTLPAPSGGGSGSDLRGPECREVGEAEGEGRSEYVDNLGRSRGTATGKSKAKVYDCSTAPFPKAMAGFSFGATVEASKDACTEAGGTWEGGDGEYFCSTLADDMGLRGSVALETCSGKICQVELRLAPASPQKTFYALESKLSKKYGRSSEREKKGGSACEDSVDECASRGTYSHVLEWRPEGGTVILGLKRRPDINGVLFVTYKRRGTVSNKL